mgnify:CR=1 FL=1
MESTLFTELTVIEQESLSGGRGRNRLRQSNRISNRQSAQATGVGNNAANVALAAQANFGALADASGDDN